MRYYKCRLVSFIQVYVQLPLGKKAKPVTEWQRQKKKEEKDAWNKETFQAYVN